jgi:hypothetical protein
MRIVALLCLFAFASSALMPGQTPTPAPTPVPTQTPEIEITADPRVYGEYPKNFQEIITNWLATVLVDPASANIQWVSTPTAATVPDKKTKKRLSGYLVEFKVNSRNRFGAYTGMQKKSVLIRDGQVIKATGFGL